MAKGKAKIVSEEEFRLPGPDELNEPPEDLQSYCMLIFGEKGIGKTSLCAQFPNAIVGMLEPRRRNLKIRQMELTSWDMVLQFVDAAVEDDTVDTVCLDTADRLYEHALNYVCRIKGVEHPNKMNDYGATWKEIKDQFESLLGTVQRSNKGLVLTSHAKWKEAELRNGEKLQILCPTLSDAPWTIIKAVADYAFYYGYHRNLRAMYLRGHEDLWCACGSEDHFLDPDGNKVRTILLGETPRLAMETLVRSFNNEVYDVDSEKAVEPAATTTVARAKAKVKAKA